MKVRDANEQDIQALCAIYNHYILNTVITFEETPVTEQEMAARIAKTRSLDLPWLVAEAEPGTVVGYAYAGLWKDRSAYRNTAEVSVYLAPSSTGRGLGTLLYKALFERLKPGHVRMVIGGVALPNAASVKLHEKFGMEKIGCFREVGYKFGQWIDVAYWQLELQRR